MSKTLKIVLTLVMTFVIILVGIKIIGTGLYFNNKKINSDTIENQTNNNKGEKDENKMTEEEIKKAKKGGVVYILPGMDMVEVKEDIVYKKIDNMELGLDIYYPLEAHNPRQERTVILIHGTTSDRGFKSRKYFRTWGRLVAASGNTAITFNWRSNSNPEDVSELINFVRENAKDYNINSENISIIVFSGGVEDGVREALSVDTGFIKSIVAYYGKMPLDILEGDRELPPIFMAKARLDDIIPSDANDEFLRKAKELQYNVTEVVHNNGKHGFDVYNDDEESYNIIAKSLEFIKESSH